MDWLRLRLLAKPAKSESEKYSGQRRPSPPSYFRKNFATLVLLAFLFASPITYWLLGKWLESFAYRIDINFGWFFVGGLIALAIALGTVGYHTVRSARSNPVDSLRYE